MEIIEIQKNQFSKYADLDPFDIYNREGKTPSLVMGIKDTEDENESVVGILLAEVNRWEISIYWIFVQPEYRGKGFGERLLKSIFDLAERKNIKFVYAYFEEHFVKKNVSHERDFFSDHYFKMIDNDVMLCKITDYKKLFQTRPLTLEDRALCLYDLFENKDPKTYKPIEK